ncbi:MAG: hypothetical protein HY054_01220 [Proteobacteria bacterium]|nr:hypothetical protein [Pseudomonadota bacterium]
MKKLIGAAIAAGATIAGAGVANAEITGNVQATTDYVFRGVSLNDNGPAFQGGIDWNNDQFYVGTWASTVIDGIEVDVYGGWTPKTGPVSWDLGVITYNYPGAHDSPDARFDYYELKAAGSMDVAEHVNLGAAVYYSPDNYGGTGTATYWEVNGAYTVNDSLNFTAAYGNQRIEDPDGPGPITSSDSYNTWNIGATYTWLGFDLDLRYHDTDIEAGSNIEAYTYGPSSYDAGVTFTVKRDL